MSSAAHQLSTGTPNPSLRDRTLACQQCQRKKRRCDRRILKSSCTNCRLDGISCVPGNRKSQTGAAKPGIHASTQNKTLHQRNSHPPGDHGRPVHDRLTPRRYVEGDGCTLPHFIKPLPSHLTTEDRDFLMTKGIFDVPEGKCRDEILRSFFQFAHPFLPLLDIETFIGPMLQNNPQDKISLLLFYAVMCHGSAHVNINVLQTLGYATRKAARKTFFERILLLYDFDCEPDLVALVQAFLLMTYFFDNQGHRRDRKFWICASVTLAQDLGLNLTLDTTDNKRQRLLKRIWWCCFMRDQFVALMTWTPPQLGAAYRNLPMLELEDFEIDLPEYISHAISDWTTLDRDSRIQLATLCIKKAKLSLCINQILQVRYESFLYESEEQTIQVLVPKNAAARPFEVVEYNRKLQAWYDSLSNFNTFDLQDPTTSALIKKFDVIAIHRAHLKLLFLTAVLALHRPQVLDHSSFLPPEYRSLSKMKIREAADEVGHIAKLIKNLEMGTHVSPRGVTLLLPILFVHLQDIRLEMDKSSGNRLEKYYNCMQILDSVVGDSRVSEDALPTELEAAFRKLNILPTQDNLPPPNIMGPNSSLSLLGDRYFPYLASLGTVTNSEVNLLTGFDIDTLLIPNEGEDEVEEDLDGRGGSSLYTPAGDDSIWQYCVL